MRIQALHCKFMCVLWFSLQGHNFCCFLLLECKRQIALCIFCLSGERMPTQLRGCHFTDNAIDILSCSCAYSESRISLLFHLSPFHLWWSYLVPSTSISLPFMLLGNSCPDIYHTDTVTRSLLGLTGQERHVHRTCIGLIYFSAMSIFPR